MPQTCKEKLEEARDKCVEVYEKRAKDETQCTTIILINDVIGKLNDLIQKVQE